MADVIDVCSAIRGKTQSPRAAIAELAARQGGVVARLQLLALGLSRHAVDRMAASGYLHPLYRGVYAAGHRNVSVHGRVMAAVLAYGPEALASHVTGGWAWGVLRWPGQPLDVTVVGRARRSRRGINVHCVRHLHPDDRVVIHGIPCMSVARVLLDLAESRPRLMRRAFDEAERKRVLDLREVQRLLERSRGHRGTPRLEALIAETTDPPPLTRSELEESFRDLLREEDIRQPDAMNAIVEGFEVDAVWFAEGVIVEIDHYATHGHRAAFERDRVRDADLALAGWLPLRVTDRQIAERTGLARRLRRALAR